MRQPSTSGGAKILLIMQQRPTTARKNRREDKEYLGGFSTKAFREHLRGYNQQPKSRAERAIGAIRLGVHSSRYDDVIRSLLTSAPVQVPHLFMTGQKRFGALLWGEPFPAVPLQDELIWTALWLNVRHPQISEFRKTALRVQALIGADAADDAIEALEKFRRTAGFTFWQVELEAATLQHLKGNAEQRAYTSKLRTDATNASVAGFVAFLIGDRNDETQTFDSFYSRSLERLPQVTVEPWLRAYLFYRVLQHYDPTPEAIALNMRNERLSSIIDLYETFVESALSIVTTFSLKSYRPAVLKALDILIAVKDDRLERIRMLAGGGFLALEKSAERDTTADIEDGAHGIGWPAVQKLALWNSPPIDPVVGILQTDVYEALTEVWQTGSHAEKAVGKALKIGVNFKALDIGIAIAGQAEKQSVKTERTLLLAPGALILRKVVGWEEIIGGPFDLSLAGLTAYVAKRAEQDPTSARILAAVKDPPASFENIPPLARLWLGNIFDFHGQYDAATTVTDSLLALGGRWAREATRSKFVMAYTRGDLATACGVLSVAIIKDDDFSLELPVSEMFLGRKWKDFSKLDPIQVGIASFVAFDAPPTSSVRHICSSTCRAVMKAGYRTLIESPPPEDMSATRRTEIAFFFATVWAEEALGRTGLFESTQDVRIERIKVMQYLLAWDKANADYFVSEIKQLTVNETLWLGLKHLNETRVFVNEPAITRWAEKELTEDYQRWIALVGAEGSGEVFTEEKLLRYLASPVDAHSGIQDITGLTEADGALIHAVNRLLMKFLTDPADGLNCYLSLRVRHGTMTGTLFGPAETADLLMPDDEPKGEALERLVLAYGGDENAVETVYAALSRFTAKQVELGNELIKDRVQILSPSKPNGLLYATLDFRGLPPTFSTVARINFNYFVDICYSSFWLGLVKSLGETREYFKESVRQEIHKMFSVLLEELQPVATQLPSLLAEVQTIATLTSAQCDIVAGWFQLPKHRGVAQQVFTIDQAIDIASRATSNVYPGFEPELDLYLNCGELPLSGVGLSTVADCLFVMLQNVVQRSGSPNSKRVSIEASMLGDDTLVLREENPVSDSVRDVLRGGRLTSLSERYAGADEKVKLVDQEGGSGLPKLWRMTRTVDNPLATEPLTFGLTDAGDWYVQVMLKLVLQENVYHAS